MLAKRSGKEWDARWESGTEQERSLASEVQKGAGQPGGNQEQDSKRREEPEQVSLYMATGPS